MSPSTSSERSADSGERPVAPKATPASQWIGSCIQAASAWLANHNDLGLHLEFDGLDFTDNICMDICDQCHGQSKRIEDVNGKSSNRTMLQRAYDWVDRHDVSEMAFELNGLHPWEAIKVPHTEKRP